MALRKFEDGRKQVRVWLPTRLTDGSWVGPGTRVTRIKTTYMTPLFDYLGKVTTYER